MESAILCIISFESFFQSEASNVNNIQRELIHTPNIYNCASAHDTVITSLRVIAVLCTYEYSPMYARTCYTHTHTYTYIRTHGGDGNYRETYVRRQHTHRQAGARYHQLHCQQRCTVWLGHIVCAYLRLASWRVCTPPQPPESFRSRLFRSNTGKCICEPTFKCTLPCHSWTEQCVDMSTCAAASD